MTDNNAPNADGGIRVLPPEEARKIAAGEVIDRPAALVREFLDNAIDAGGRNIEVIIEEGGLARTEVVDDGRGMDRADIELCWLTHATSKIRSLDDLGRLASLGFRGEALAAAAAVSRLEILSSRGGGEAWKLGVGPGENPPLIEQSRRSRGTSVRALGLYDTVPARRRFMKRPASEAAACRQIFNEKALAFPEISFRFSSGGILAAFFPPAPSLKERFRRIFLSGREGVFLHEITAAGKGFSASVVFGGPELSRKDRRLEFVFANSRRIQDFSLLQALEYGLDGWFPNGTHPLGAVFVTVDPALADFNIHPAKREARFADPGLIHHGISAALRDFCRRGNLAASERRTEEHPPRPAARLFGPGEGGFQSSRKETESLESRLALEALLRDPPRFAPLPGRAKGVSLAAEENPPYTAGAETDGGGTSREDAGPPELSGKIQYLGQLFGLFILAAKDSRLFIIDQHAAHERILYDRFIGGPIPRQELLVPLPFSTESPEDDRFLLEKREELAELGIVIKKDSSQWLVEALPAGWKLSDSETAAEILKLKSAGKNLAEHWAALVSCRAAVKDGDYLDETSALALAEKAFALPIRRCPHGRPIWFEISRDDLLKAVKRL